ncbi:addiction module toxin, HicA family protein [Spirochaetia bacterium]|nr:addiction module toxin, HicA family protein [Spirochaetia bacterium]
MLIKMGKVYTSGEMIKIVTKDGWKLDHVIGSHHIFYHETKPGMVTVPVHTKDLAKGTANSILKQAGLK